MYSNSTKLDLGMQILLAHALRTEAGQIKQFYPQATRLFTEHGQELLQLKDGVKLLRTGMGLEKTEAALTKHVDPDNLDLIIHFGVSGSLKEELPIQALIQGVEFKCEDQQTIRLQIPEISSDLMLPKLDFYSSRKVVSDEVARVATQRTGASAVDMESYAVASFCQSWNIPLLALRCISDRAGASTPDDFKQNFDEASKRLQLFILKQVLTLL